jgi:probable phosphoglycerate mutase
MKHWNIDKVVYFVRHGQTLSNITDTVQGLDDPLSPHGELQAEKIAERAQSLDFETIIASDALRAQQTAQVVAERTKHTLVTSDLFREIRRPSSFFGTPRLADAFQEFAEEWWERAQDNWRHSDEETAAEFISRSKLVLDFIDARPEKSLLVVTHGYFLTSVAARVMLGGELSAEQFRLIQPAMWSENTGITICLRADGKWRLLTWNDHAHLG